MRYTDFLSDLRRNLVEIDFLFKVGAVFHNGVFAQVQNNGFFFYAEVEECEKQDVLLGG